MEFTGYRNSAGDWLSAEDVRTAEDGRKVERASRRPVEPVKLEADDVRKQGDAFVLRADAGVKVDSRAYKMSKSRGNVVNPDQVVANYGADCLRLYEMFMGPLEAVKPWSTEGVSGVRGFLDRVWRMITDERAEDLRLNQAVQETEPSEEQNRVLHKTIRAVTGDLDQMAFNTAIARMMEFVNFFLKEDCRPKAAMETFVLVLAPFAPHIAEELWRLLGHEDTLAYEPWPEFDDALLREDTVEIPVQINGKLRGRIKVPAAAAGEQLAAAARGDPRVAKRLAGKTIVKEVVVPGRMVSFVVK